MIPVLGLIGAGLSVLPKIPEIWSTVAGLFGKQVPKGIEEAGKLAGDILGQFEKGQIPVEKQMELKSLLYAHEEKIIQFKLDEKRLDYEHEETAWSTYRQLEAEDARSSNQFRTETRPRILRDMFKLTAAYVLFAPLALLAARGLGFDVTEMMGLLKWMGGFLFSTFASAYLGYTAVRSIWDKKGEARPDNMIMSALSKVF